MVLLLGITRQHFSPNQRFSVLVTLFLACNAAADAAGLSLWSWDAAARQVSQARGSVLHELLGLLQVPGRRSMQQQSTGASFTGKPEPEPGKSPPEATESQPELAAAYMESLLADPAAARTRLCGNFTKRSKVAVVYMCFERMEMIERAIPAILRSEGLNAFDLFISQDGGAGSIFHDELFAIPHGTPYVYIHHPANLCPGLHHFFVKTFAFDIMGYETLLVVEEDNVIHPQALKLLARMVELSLSEPSVGVVSLLDMDMSTFLNASRFSAGVTLTDGATGHLWVFGLHRSKYEPARGCLRDYYNVIKGHDYRMKHEPPLRDAIEALMRAKGFPMPSPLSQDRWFINSLAKYGFRRRYQTLFRFFEPIGHYGLHFRLNESHFYGLFGRQMFSGRIDPSAAFDVTRDPRLLEDIRQMVAARLEALRARYWGAVPLPDWRLNSTVSGLLDGRLNGIELVKELMAGPPKEPPLPPKPPAAAAAEAPWAAPPAPPARRTGL